MSSIIHKIASLASAAANTRVGQRALETPVGGRIGLFFGKTVKVKDRDEPRLNELRKQYEDVAKLAKSVIEGTGVPVTSSTSGIQAGEPNPDRLTPEQLSEIEAYYRGRPHNGL